MPDVVEQHSGLEKRAENPLVTPRARVYPLVQEPRTDAGQVTKKSHVFLKEVRRRVGNSVGR
jgi:hypothetical protein